MEVIDGQALGSMALSNSFDIAVLILMVMALLPIVFLVINRTLRTDAANEVRSAADE